MLSRFRSLRPSLSFFTDSLLIALLTVALIWPLFKIKYLDNWSSIESTFISDARFLKDHWPHPQWQPLWYGGTRIDYVYPPALRYGTAALSRTFAILPVRAYHIYTAFFFSLGFAGVYLFIRAATRSRGAAWLGAAAAALVSPCYAFISTARVDGLHSAPWRLQVLMKYGEGPHIAALALIPFALAASWLALRRSRPVMFALAALVSALVVSTNFYGATALAIFYPVLCWSLWITHQDRRIWQRALGIAALAYGLTAFWLVPSYLRVTTANMKLVAAQGNMWSLWVTLAVVAAFLIGTDRWARGRKELAYPVFTVGACLLFTLNGLGNHYFDFRVLGEPSRLIPEMDLAMILLALEGLRRLWSGWPGIRHWIPRAVAVLLVLAAFSTSRHYLRHPHNLFTREPNFQQRIEYRLQDWVARNLPQARTFVTGSVRFWYDTWHDLPQLGGGSEQGMINQMIIAAQWQNQLASQAAPSILWLQNLGVDAVAVHDAKSREVYHDFVYPAKFAGLLPVLFDDGQGNVLYRVPRRFSSLVRVIDSARLAAVRPYVQERQMEFLTDYAGVVENGPPAPASLSWKGTDAMHVRAATGPGQAVLLQVTYDPAWRAYSAGNPIPIRKDPMGQMVLDLPPGDHDVSIVFETPLENRVGRVLSALSGAGLLALFALGFRRREVRP